MQRIGAKLNLDINIVHRKKKFCILSIIKEHCAFWKTFLVYNKIYKCFRILPHPGPHPYLHVFSSQAHGDEMDFVYCIRSEVAEEWVPKMIMFQTSLLNFVFC